MTDPTVTLVAAVADNGVIGADGGIPWRIPEDFAHFKATTMGGVMVMGRTTFESIGRPLPGRTTIVVSRDPAWACCGVNSATSVDDALDMAVGIAGHAFVVGGAAIYEAAMPHADAQVLTEVHISPDGDTYYPDFDRSEWVETRRESHLDAEVPYEFVWWRRG